jgi:hypothetical protein
MFNVFGRNIPSHPGQNTLDDAKQALAEEDVSRILQVFKIGDLSSDNQDMILSNSENALVKPAACIDMIKEEWETGKYKDIEYRSC